MLKNNFIEWRSEGKNIDNEEAFKAFERDYGLFLPLLYKDLVRNRDGGFLEKDRFFYKKGEFKTRNIICDFLCWNQDTMEDDYIFNRLQDPPAFFPKGLIPFAPDGSGNYICFDYRNCYQNPSIVFWHHEIEDHEGILYLAPSFEEFINNLKSEDEVDL